MTTTARSPYRGRYFRAVFGVLVVGVLLLLFAVRSGDHQALAGAVVLLAAAAPLSAAAFVMRSPVDQEGLPWTELGLLLAGVALAVCGLVIYGA